MLAENFRTFDFRGLSTFLVFRRPKQTKRKPLFRNPKLLQNRNQNYQNCFDISESEILKRTRNFGLKQAKNTLKTVRPLRNVRHIRCVYDGRCVYMIYDGQK